MVEKPPAFDGNTRIIWDNLTVLHCAKQAFVSSESFEKLLHAIDHNVCLSGNVQFFTGDKVYYKRITCGTLTGPAGWTSSGQTHRYLSEYIHVG